MSVALISLVSAEASVATRFSEVFGSYIPDTAPRLRNAPPDVVEFDRINNGYGFMVEEEFLYWKVSGMHPSFLSETIARVADAYKKSRKSSMIFWGAIIVVDMQAPHTFITIRQVLEELVRVRMPFVVAGNSINPAVFLHKALRLSERIPVVYYDVNVPESVKQVYLTLLRQVRPTEKLQRIIDYFEAL